jgi:hypothetical protein
VKPEQEFRPVSDVQLTPVDARVPGLRERILTRDPATGVVTRILSFDVGTDTSPLGTQVHSFWEEVYILSGSLIDLRLGEEFPSGSFACRPPGMAHGPWVAPVGCVTFEVRYSSVG